MCLQQKSVESFADKFTLYSIGLLFNLKIDDIEDQALSILNGALQDSLCWLHEDCKKASAAIWSKTFLRLTRLVQKISAEVYLRNGDVAEDAAALLTKIGHETSLRYAIHLITAAYLIGLKRKAAKVDVEDVARAYTLFIDVKRSTEYMLEHQQQYLYNEAPETDQLDGTEEIAVQ